MFRCLYKEKCGTFGVELEIRRGGGQQEEQWRITVWERNFEVVLSPKEQVTLSSRKVRPKSTIILKNWERTLWHGNL